MCVMELKSSQKLLKNGISASKIPVLKAHSLVFESLQFVNVDSQVGGGGAVLLWPFIIKDCNLNLDEKVIGGKKEN